MRKLSDILRAAFVHSQAGQQPQALQVGRRAAQRRVRLRRDVAPGGAQRAAATNCRRRGASASSARWRCCVAAVLSGSGLPSRDVAPYDFAFDNCAAATAAYRARLPPLVEVVKAIAIAELEARRRATSRPSTTRSSTRYDEHALTADDLALFPDYLVCIPAERNDAPENAALLEMLSAGLPVKVLVQLSDLLEEAAIGTGHFAFGVRSARLATTAMGLGGMFVLQSASSNLYALRERVRQRHGLPRAGAVQRVRRFAGRRRRAAALPDRRRGDGVARVPGVHVRRQCRRQLGDPVLASRTTATRTTTGRSRSSTYADEDLQRVSEQIRFTYADFVLCDQRNAQHFAVVPRERWTSRDGAGGRLAGARRERGRATACPIVLAVDANDRLHRVIVDARLMQATRRCVLLWHRLQEHGGIHNSHAEQAAGAREGGMGGPEAAGARGAAPGAAAAAPASVAPVADAAAPTAEAAAPAAAEAAPAPSSDEAWIETTRCPSCNECQNINDKLFGYNENKQAYIKDINAGTYRELVEAAEACQVAIIHPGKPWNASEPGLEELLERAKPFMA